MRCIIGIEKVLKPQVVVVEQWEREAANVVVTENRAASKLQVLHSSTQVRFAGKKCGRDTARRCESSNLKTT